MDFWGIYVVVFLILAAIVAWRETVGKRRAKRRIRAWDPAEWDQRRWDFLRAIHDRAGGSPTYPVRPGRLRKELGWEWAAVHTVRDDLASAGLVTIDKRRKRDTFEDLGFVEARPPKGSDATSERLYLTAAGAQAARSGDGPGLFSRLGRPGVQVSGSGHQVMVDSPRGLQARRSRVTQHGVDDALRAFRRALDLDPSRIASRSDAAHYLALAEAESAAVAPDHDILERLLRKLGDIATSAAGSAAWQGAAATIARVVGG